MAEKTRPEKLEKLCESVYTGRREFIKKAIIGTALAVPVIDSFTRSGIVVKAALAQTVRSFIITIQNNGGGNVNPSGPVSVTQGGSVLITFNPFPGYLIGNVVVDGVSQGGISQYQFTNVQKDILVEVFFTPLGTFNGD
jgi:hypothetical protein